MQAKKIEGFSPVRGLRRVPTALMALVLAGAAIGWPTNALAADHRDSPTADANPEGDIADVFAFLDPNDPTQFVMIMTVSGYSIPAQANYSFANNILYQFKFALTQNTVEDLVIQATFASVPAATCASGQMVNIYGPAAPNNTGLLNTVLNQTPTVSGCTQITVQQNGMQVFAGLRDDPFVTDVGQLMRINQSKQDLFRAYPNSPLGALRGRPVRADNTSGVDGFGGFNVEAIAIELPKSVFSAFGGSVGEIAMWGTTSLPISTGSTAIASVGHEHLAPVGPATYMQFQRNGQQIFKTVFVPSAMREAFNASIPANDMQNWASLIPGTLTTKDNDGTGNTVAARQALLATLGLTDAGTAAAGAGHGAPLLNPASFVNNTNPNLLLAALLPDVLRINLGLIPSGILPGAAAAGGNADPQLAIGAFGLQNGRRPADITTDILLQVARQLADINFPASLGVPGSGPARPNGLNFGTDKKINLVLQGTNWIRPDSQAGNVSGNVAPYGGNDQPELSTFPFLAPPSPLPGETGTVGFPAQQ